MSEIILENWAPTTISLTGRTGTNRWKIVGYWVPVGGRTTVFTGTYRIREQRVLKIEVPTDTVR